ncbi:GGDEF domain-containing protein [Caproicibacter sp.]|uniref:GGDEF domain-containing protein n=1 Tax=Caproicibacter sp. TaxID=2814884 RepID=UPI0039895043
MKSSGDGAKPGRRTAYFNYQLISSRKYINQVCLAVGVFNEALLIPDSIFVKSPMSKLLIVLFRTLFTGLLVLFSLYCSRARGYRSFYRCTTGMELLAVAIFLFVLVQYDPPNFMVQAAGLYILLLAFFLVPNRYRNMLAVSTVGMAGFLYFSWRKLGGLSIDELMAAVIYFAATVLICSIFALGRDRQQYGEFLSKAQLMKLSYTDQLTRASSRNRLFSEFARWQKICLGRQRPLSLSLFDIDRFKSVNDQFGHSIADRVLAELADVIRAHLRSSDLLVRWGGDEFVILFPETDRNKAAGILNRVRYAIEKKRFAGKIHITCSFGLAEMEEGSTLDSMVQKADDLMYSAKKQGGNRVEIREEKAQ